MEDQSLKSRGKRKNPRPAPRPFYLGNRETADRRIARLDAIAERHGLTRSQLLQAIADGEFTLQRVRRVYRRRKSDAGGE